MIKNGFMGVLIVAVAAVCVIAATDDELRDITFQRLNSAAEKQRELNTKVYTGTFAEVLAARAADVNDVTVDIVVARGAAMEAIGVDRQIADPNAMKTYVAQVITEKTKEAVIQAKFRNATFLIAVEELLADPNHVPEPNDIEGQQQIQEFRTACLACVNEMGGL